VSALFCIHGHFYQPAREHPWLDAVEVEDSAAPFHDWNARITAESYAPNAAARILDARGRIERIVNNYTTISFNFGPTLLRWLDQAAPDVAATGRVWTRAVSATRWPSPTTTWSCRWRAAATR
jgi:alpha-amylase/alpha-mannosidase (GH57 family)